MPGQTGRPGSGEGVRLARWRAAARRSAAEGHRALPAVRWAVRS